MVFCWRFLALHLLHQRHEAVGVEYGTVELERFPLRQHARRGSDPVLKPPVVIAIEGRGRQYADSPNDNKAANQKGGRSDLRQHATGELVAVSCGEVALVNCGSAPGGM